MAGAGQVSSREKPSSAGVCYAYKVCYKSPEYCTPATAAGGSDETGRKLERGDATDLAASVTNMFQKLVADFICKWMGRTGTGCEAA